MYVLCPAMVQFLESNLYLRELLPENLKKDKSSHPVWKCQDFSVTQILREINFGEYTLCGSQITTTKNVKFTCKSLSSIESWYVLEVP